MTHPFDDLARLAELDELLLQLERSRATLPARVALSEVAETLSDLAQRRSQRESEKSPLSAALDALEHDVEHLASRAAQIEARLASSTGGGRELASMDTERQHLIERQRELEDQEIELMESLEPIDAAIASIEDSAAPLVAERERLAEVLLAEEAGLAEQIEQATASRSEVASNLDDALLSRYERISKSVHGSGAARLLDGRCTGCHLVLPAVEIGQIGRLGLDEIATCEQCERILIRSAQLDG